MSSTENTADVTPQPEEAVPAAGSDAVTPDAGTPAAAEPADAALADPTADAAAGSATDGSARGAADGAADEAADEAAVPAEAAAAPPEGQGEQEVAGEEVAGEEVADSVPAPDAAEVVAAADVPAAGDVLDVSETVETTDAVGAADSDGADEQVPTEAAVTDAADTPTTSTDVAATPHAPAAPAAPPTPAAPASDPTLWGRVEDEGTVYVRTADGGERAVGSWQAGEPAEGLAHYGRRYDDLATEIGLLEARLRANTGNPAEIRAKAQALAEQVPTADVVGDLPALASRLGTILEASEAAAAVARAEKAKVRGEQIARKEALAAEAETIAADSTQWKAAGDRLKAIVEEWKTIKGIDRKTDEALWTRFAAARDAFGRRRGSHFAALDVQRSESRAAKSALIAEAEKLATSTEWGPTSAAMRSLMDRWKAVPRVGRDTDDDLWKKFRAAQDVFFDARSESDKARNSEHKANQEQKEALLAEAEKIDPSRDLRGAQNALRKIQERYDAIGHVPREVMRSLEDRMQAVEEKVRGAADSGRPRAVAENPMLTSLRAAAEKAADQLSKAKAAGDPKRISDAEANLASRQEFLAAAEKAGSRR